MHKVKCTKEAKKLLDKSIQRWIDAHVKLVCDSIKPCHFAMSCPLCLHVGCGRCPISIDGQWCNADYSYWHKWYIKGSTKAHLAMITYMKDLYKRCVVE